MNACLVAWLFKERSETYTKKTIGKKSLGVFPNVKKPSSRIKLVPIAECQAGRSIVLRFRPVYGARSLNLKLNFKQTKTP
jgi:hypothetical protein